MSAVPVLLLVVAAVFCPAQADTSIGALKPCHRSDPKLSECLMTSINDALPTLIKGVPALEIPVLDPFRIEKIQLREDKAKNHPLSLDLTLTHLTVTGIKTMKFTLDSKLDLVNMKIEVRGIISHINLEGLYKMDGKVLLLPIKGEGDTNITLADTKIVYSSDLTLYKGKDGKQHLKGVSPKLDFKPKHMTMHFNNLFNGDKTLGDTMNSFLNDNWREVLVEFGPAFEETVSTIVGTLFNNLAKHIAYDDVFPE